jgi:hypothetical protein
MAIDFTVIQPVRQRFGDSNPDYEWPQEQEAPFVGTSKDFSFACPGVDSSQWAVLQLESFAIHAGRVAVFTPGYPRNILRINDVDVPGGLTPGASEKITNLRSEHFWKSHTLLVPANVLRDTNVLHVESVKLPSSAGTTNFDNFIIDNVIVFFKLRRPVGGEMADPHRQLSTSRTKKKKKKATRKATPRKKKKSRK